MDEVENCINEVNKLIINKLSKLLKGGKFNKTSLADACGYTRTTINNILAGNDFHISTLIKIAEAYELPLSYFFEDDYIPKNGDSSRLLRMLENEINNNKQLVVTNATLVAENQRLRGAVAPTGKGLSAAAGE